MSVVNEPMNTNTPSDVAGSPSSAPSRLWRKNPYWLPPVAVRASDFWVTTPRTS